MYVLGTCTQDVICGGISEQDRQPGRKTEKRFTPNFEKCSRHREKSYYLTLCTVAKTVKQTDKEKKVQSVLSCDIAQKNSREEDGENYTVLHRHCHSAYEGFPAQKRNGLITLRRRIRSHYSRMKIGVAKTRDGDTDRHKQTLKENIYIKHEQVSICKKNKDKGSNFSTLS